MTEKALFGNKHDHKVRRWACGRAALLAAFAAASLPAVAHATEPWSEDARPVDPWSDADPPEEPERLEVGNFGLRGGAEYRANMLYVNPVALNSETARRLTTIQHRLRLDGTIDYKDKVRVVVSTDVLDGVVWGDNGDYGGNPSSNAGTNVSVKAPNVTGICVGPRAGADPLQADGYGYVPCDTQVFKFRKLYGDVALPFGLVRIGRQPVNVGTGVQSADGDGRPNRFGMSGAGNYVDRVLFATKPLEAFKPKDERDDSAHRGLILALAYDRWVSDNPQLFDDDVQQVNASVRFAAPRYPIGKDLQASAYYAHRWDQQYDSAINSFGMRAMSRFGPVYVGLDVAANVGATREISEAYSKITGDLPVSQAVRQVGARGVVRIDQPLWSGYLEVDYASGDADPSSGTPLTQFVFSEDTNVGLLMFEHVLGFQSARSAAAGVETLRRLRATTNPAEAISTRGSFTNAFALFPQVDVHPHPSVLLRGGVLMAWAPSGVVSPVDSLQRRDGLTIDDDVVNFVGGKPGGYYGTEIDLRGQWRYEDHFAFDLEGAILFPGDALQNEDGYAVRSVLIQGRTTFFF